MPLLKDQPGPEFPESQGFSAPAIVESRMLFREGSELVIVHNGRHYRLRITQSGKLILTA